MNSPTMDDICSWIYGNCTSVLSIHLQQRALVLEGGGIRGAMVAHWTAGQQVERLILRQGHDS